MKEWSNKEHEKMLEEKRQKAREKELKEMLNLNSAAVPKTKMVERFRPADPRLVINEIVDPIYMSIEQFRQAAYIPDYLRSRIIIVEFVEEEDDRT